MLSVRAFPVVLQNWLYEEGEDETKAVYVEKLVELRKQGDPIVVRNHIPYTLKTPPARTRSFWAPTK